MKAAQAAALLGLGLALGSHGAQPAQAPGAPTQPTAPSTAVPRDPTVPPPAARASGRPGETSSKQPPDEALPEAPSHLMVLGGKAYVMERGWPRGVGDRYGSARIERIDPHAVWLRLPQGTLQRWPLYPGVALSAATPAAAPIATPIATPVATPVATSAPAPAPQAPAQRPASAQPPKDTRP